MDFVFVKTLRLIACDTSIYAIITGEKICTDLLTVPEMTSNEPRHEKNNILVSDLV